MEFKTKLRWVKIFFDTASFDKITKDEKAPIDAKISSIGGTMGLLTGFSLISAVEIIYFMCRMFAFMLDKVTGRKTKTDTRN